MIRTSLFAAGLTSFLALGATACGDSGGADARGALHFRVGATDSSLTPGGMACNQLFFADEYIPPDDYMPSDTGPGVAFANGENGIQVSCKVAGSGGGFDVDLKLGNGDTSFELYGNVDEFGEGSSLSGSVSQRDWFGSLATRTVNGRACNFTATGGSFFIKRGAVYGSFDCPVLTDPPDTACRVSGHVYFERCSG